MNLRMILGVFGLTVFILNSSLLEANDAGVSKKNANAGLKSIKGEVGMIRPGYIEVEYALDEEGAHAMVFPLSRDVEIQNKKSIGEIQQGDAVELTYEERTWITEEGKAQTEIKVKKIRFVKAAPPENPLPAEETE